MRHTKFRMGREPLADHVEPTQSRFMAFFATESQNLSSQADAEDGPLMDDGKFIEHFSQAGFVKLLHAVVEMANPMRDQAISQKDVCSLLRHSGLNAELAQHVAHRGQVSHTVVCNYHHANA